MTPSRALRFGAHAGRGVRRLAVDAALGGRCDFPRTVGDLTPELLSAITRLQISGIAVLDGAAGTSSRARLGLTGVDVPESVFVKMPAASAGIRMLGELAGLGETEAQFYRHLADELAGVTPTSYGADFDPLTGRYVVILEDMTLSPCQFPDTLHPLDPDQMSQLVDCFAQLHGNFWGRLPEKNSSTGQFGWLMAPSWDPSNPITPSVMKMSARRLAERTDIAAGGPELDRDDLFSRYRQAVVHPYISGLSTAGLGGMQDDDVALEGLHRAVAALDDLDTVGALETVLASGV